MSLANALDAALKLKLALATEVARAKDVRTILKDLRSSELLAQASLRQAFNEHSTWLSSLLAKGLSDYAGSIGQTDVTLEQLRQREPYQGEQLAAVFAEIRALSASLAELDAFNSHLAERALTFVKAYVCHLSPHPTAYTRRGQLAPTEAGTHSERI